MGAGATGKFDLADWKKAFIIFAVLSVVLAATIFHQPLTHGIIEFFKHQQNPETEDSARGEPAPKDAEVHNLKGPEVYDSDNSQVSDQSISGMTTLTEPEASIADISQQSEQNPPPDQQEPVVNEPTPDGKETLARLRISHPIQQRPMARGNLCDFDFYPLRQYCPPRGIGQNGGCPSY